MRHFRDGAIKATIWRNEGDKGPFYSVEFGRTYTDAEDNYKDTSSFSGADLLKVSRLAVKAYDKIGELRAEDKKRGS